MALQTFVMASRCTGRTSALIAAARAGDVIITGTGAEKRRIESLLRQSGKIDVVVRYFDPAKANWAAIGPNRRGATLFDHYWLEAYWQSRLSDIRADVVKMQRYLSGALPPEQEQSVMADRLDHWEMTQTRR